MPHMGPMRGKAKKGTMTRLVKQLFKRYPKRLIFAGFCIVFNAFGNLCSTIFVSLVTGVLTSAIIKGVNPFDITASIESSVFGGSLTISTNITVLLIAMASVYFLGIFSSWWWNREMAIITQEFLNDFRIAMFNHMQDLPIKYFDTHPHGDIMSIYTNDIDTIRQFISQTLPEILRASITVVMCIVFMLINSIWMSLIVFLGTYLMFLNTKIIGGISSKFFKKQQMQVGVVEGAIQESMKGLKVIKVFTHEEKSYDEFAEKDETLREYI